MLAVKVLTSLVNSLTWLDKVSTVCLVSVKVLAFETKSLLADCKLACTATKADLIVATLSVAALTVS